MLNQVESVHSSSLRDIFERGAIYSQKITSFFGVYEELFSKYIGQPITFVEVGVSQGGSLFMWREYFGPQARIIGVELNPAAKKWEKDGFEIFIGDQGDPKFWSAFFEKVGRVDVLLDDGGHTNVQQVATLSSAVDHVNDGGVILIEDVHTSYMSVFGNPSRFSFVNFAKTIVDTINSRMDKLKPVRNVFFNRVSSVAFYESMVAFHIDSRKAVVSTTIDNGGLQAARRICAHLAPRHGQRILPGATRHSSRMRPLCGRSRKPAFRACAR